MLKMLNRGDASLMQLKGSWAGGMGHTQFIPSTWIQEGVDGNQDGQISPWGIGDSLNSTASYLKMQVGLQVFRLIMKYACQATLIISS